ncbi:Arf-GAP with coiled-coil, ANK repeat and PH domain-containing protein 2 [Varanus komodoensis]|nr:Arf-GAP with coiled-coil, ANK repeat and PH domain-containing protein 2 [Varanus komodoensis]
MVVRAALDFEECLKDSPRFRAALEDVEGDVTELELKLDKLVKLCIAMIDTGKAFCVANKQFMNGIRDLAQYSSRDALVEVSARQQRRSGLQKGQWLEASHRLVRVAAPCRAGPVGSRAAAMGAEGASEQAAGSRAAPF